MAAQQADNTVEPSAPGAEAAPSKPTDDNRPTREEFDRLQAELRAARAAGSQQRQIDNQVIADAEAYRAAQRTPKRRELSPEAKKLLEESDPATMDAYRHIARQEILDDPEVREALEVAQSVKQREHETKAQLQARRAREAQTLISALGGDESRVSDTLGRQILVMSNSPEFADKTVTDLYVMLTGDRTVLPKAPAKKAAPPPPPVEESNEAVAPKVKKKAKSLREAWALAKQDNPDLKAGW